MTFKVVIILVVFLCSWYSRPLGLTDSSLWLLIFEVLFSHWLLESG